MHHVQYGHDVVLDDVLKRHQRLLMSNCKHREKSVQLGPPITQIARAPDKQYGGTCRLDVVQCLEPHAGYLGPGLMKQTTGDSSDMHQVRASHELHWNTGENLWTSGGAVLPDVQLKFQLVHFPADCG